MRLLRRRRTPGPARAIPLPRQAADRSHDWARGMGAPEAAADAYAAFVAARESGRPGVDHEAEWPLWFATLPDCAACESPWVLRGEASWDCQHCGATRPVATWQPDDGGSDTCSADAMQGECAGEQAYGVAFVTDAAPSATMTIWAFAAHAGQAERDGFMVAYAVGYEAHARRNRRRGWQATRWHADPEASDIYGTAAGADQAARSITCALAAYGPGEVTGIPSSWLDWDGQPW